VRHTGRRTHPLCSAGRDRARVAVLRPWRVVGGGAERRARGEGRRVSARFVTAAIARDRADAGRGGAAGGGVVGEVGQRVGWQAGEGRLHYIPRKKIVSLAPPETGAPENLKIESTDQQINGRNKPVQHVFKGLAVEVTISFPYSLPCRF
jgi:hypothetical protein